jgi:hypothetical protein
LLYRVIHKSLRDFRPLRNSSRDSHAEAELVNRGRDTPNFCRTLQLLDMSTLGDAADVNPVIKFLPHTCVARVWQELESRWGEIFRICPYRPWGPPRSLYNGYRKFLGLKERPGRDADPSRPSSAVVMKG